ncbi:MAG: hypothetical protein AB7G93_05975 [Bdellovibrionales bacterium]
MARMRFFARFLLFIMTFYAYGAFAAPKPMDRDLRNALHSDQQTAQGEAIHKITELIVTNRIVSFHRHHIVSLIRRLMEIRASGTSAAPKAALLLENIRKQLEELIDERYVSDVESEEAQVAFIHALDFGQWKETQTVAYGVLRDLRSLTASAREVLVLSALSNNIRQTHRNATRWQTYPARLLVHFRIEESRLAPIRAAARLGEDGSAPRPELKWALSKLGCPLTLTSAH